MKTGTTDIYRLIRRMSMSEKRYFRIISGQHVKGEENQYVKLFEAICRFDLSRDEEAKRIIGRQFRHFKKTKETLYGRLLDALAGFHRSGSVESRLGREMDHIRALYEKDMHVPCLKKIRQAKDLASRSGMHWHLSEILGWEAILMRRSGYAGQTEAGVNNLYHEISGAIDKYRNLKEYQQLSSMYFFSISKKGFPRNSGDVRYYRRLSAHPLLRDPRSAISFEALYSYYNIRAAFFSITNRTYQSYRHLLKTIALFDAHPHQVELHPKAYVAAIKNLIIDSLQLDRYGEVPAYLQRIRKAGDRAKAIRKEALFSAYDMELSMYIITGRFGEAVRVKDAMEQWVKDSGYPLSPLDDILMHYGFSSACFGSGNLTAAKKYINHIINNPGAEARSDLYNFARILNMLILFETNDSDLLEYEILSAYRYLVRKKKLYRFEDMIMRFLRNTGLKGMAGETLLREMRTLRSKLVALKKDPYERNVLNYFDLVSWLDSKIERCTFAEAVQKRTGAAGKMRNA